MTFARSALATFGFVCLIAGLAGLAAIGAAVYGDCTACQAWSLRLGLGLSLLLSAVAQMLVLVGGWLIWWSRRPAKPPGDLA